MNDKAILLTNIQRFSLHDGPGIRTTVFLKGCSLHCPWCSNPENILPNIQEYVKDGVNGTFGRYMNADELVNECLKDKAYYGGKLSTPDLWRITNSEEIDLLPGGVTFSGGECLLQIQSLVPVINSLHANGVHIAVETALFVSSASIELALRYIDFFYVDIKIIDVEKCKSRQNGDLGLYLSNLDKVMHSSIPIVIRVPVIGGQTDGNENRMAVRELLKKYKRRVLKIELIKEHNLGESKYRSIGMKMQYNGVSDELMVQYKAELENVGIPVDICRI